MLDDLLELALDVGGEVLGTVVEHLWDRKKRPKREKTSEKADPWCKKAERPPWEE